MPQDFSCTDVEFMRTKMNTIWNDANYRREIQPQTDVVTNLVNIQTANLTVFNPTDKKVKVKTYWVEACEGAVQDCTTDCAFTGTNVSSNCKDYEITGCKETIFTINDADFYDNYVDFQEAVAKGLLKHTTLLDNFIETQVIAALDSFAGVNQYDGDSRADVVGTDTFIEGAYWTPSLMSYFEKVKMLNYMPEGVMFSGENMYDAYWHATKDVVDANGKSSLNKFDAFGWYFDLKNMDTVLGAKRTLMVSPHAAAFVSNNRISSPVDNPNKDIQSMFTVDSMNIPGVKYDVYYRNECSGGEDTAHHWRIVARYDVFQSPVLCANDVTGILSFDCGVAP